MTFKKIFSISCIFLMLLFAYFQWNDPDPHIWIPLYLIPALMFYLMLEGILEKTTLFFVSAIYFLWGLSLFPKQWEGVLLNELGMKTINIELGRESLGLMLVALLLLFCTFFKNEK